MKYRTLPRQGPGLFWPLPLSSLLILFVSLVSALIESLGDLRSENRSTGSADIHISVGSVVEIVVQSAIGFTCDEPPTHIALVCFCHGCRRLPLALELGDDDPSVHSSEPPRETLHEAGLSPCPLGIDVAHEFLILLALFQDHAFLPFEALDSTPE